MGSFDSVTWQALTALLTLAGLAATVAFWRLRGPVAGLRTLAVSLLPAAAYLTGTLRLLWEIGAAGVQWAARLTFSPWVWLGLGIAAVAAALFVLASVLARHGVGTRTRPRELAEETSRGPAATATQPPAADDMADIEAILKRHGIS